MLSDQSLRELLARGVQLTYGETIAIVQELITCVPTDTRPRPPFGPPSLDNVRISQDGSVECVGFDATPGISEIARLLDQLLPRGGGSRVPGGLRYTVARALLEVDAPPFDSVAALSAALARYEHGDRVETIRRLYARAVAPLTEVQSDRRRRGTSSAELRRRLLEADELLYLQTLAQTLAVVPAAVGPPQGIIEPPTPIIEPPTPIIEPPTPIIDPASAPIQRRDRVARRNWIVAGATAALVSFAAGYAIVGSVHPAPRSRNVAAAPSPARDLPSTVVVPPVAVPPTVVPALRRRASLEAAGAPPHSATLIRAVSAASGATFSPTFASNGTAVFFHSGKSSDPRSSLEAAQLDADNLRVMTILDDGAKNYHVRPSPDGTRLAFDSDRDGERGVYVANGDGTGARRVSGPGFAAVPSWSPDGGTLAFIRAEADRPRVWNLWLQQLDTGRSRRLTSFRFGQTWSASWFPDGRRICFTHEDRLIVMDLTSGATREYSSPVSHALMRTPAVSPDGKRVVFQVARSGAWLLDLENGSMRCVLTDPTAEEFAWSPDGLRFAFHSRRDGEWGIWLMTST